MSEGGPSAGAEKQVGVCLSNSAVVCRDPDSVAFGGVFRSQNLPLESPPWGTKCSREYGAIVPFTLGCRGLAKAKVWDQDGR